MEMLLPVELETNSKPKSIPLTADQAARYAGKFAHARRERGKSPLAAEIYFSNKTAKIMNCQKSDKTNLTSKTAKFFSSLTNAATLSIFL